MPARDGQKMTERCPDWAIPSRRLAWRLGVAFCLMVWGGVLAAVLA